MRDLPKTSAARIVFLHHSTGESIWTGGKTGLASRVTKKLNRLLGWRLPTHALVPSLLAAHNRKQGTQHNIVELSFPKHKPYGWRNYPFDYYNIWVKHAANEPVLGEPTLEMLSRRYDLIIFKHCFPVSNIQPENGSSDINSDFRSLANYKLQYLALREKLYRFPSVKFLVWTGAAQVQARTTEAEAKRARDFFQWVSQEWDQPDDNLFVWDFFELQTEGGLYFQPKYAVSEVNSHPNPAFSAKVAPLFVRRLIDVAEANGCNTRGIGALQSC